MILTKGLSSFIKVNYKKAQDIYLALVKNPELEILYEDDGLIAIHKPHGLLVHKTSIAKDATEFALQILRNQIGQKVYPAHRLDRKTSGVLLFSKHPEANRAIQQLFREGKVQKTYHAIVRGHVLEPVHIDYALTHDEKKQEAITDIRPLEHYTISIKTDRYPTSRYSLLEVHPTTGRFHQIRKHLAHIRHPIIGDRPHGCNKQNRYWKQKLGMTTMMLCASSLAFEYKSTPLKIEAPLSKEFSSFHLLLKGQHLMRP